MTKSLMLPLTMAMGIALAPSALAQTMAPQGSNMSNTSSDTMSGKTEAMNKGASREKADDKTDTKKDGMAK